MKPRSKSVWMTPAACGCLRPLGMVQAWASLGPTVKKVIRSKRLVAGTDDAGQARFLPAPRSPEIRPARLRRQLRDFGLDRRRNDHRAGALRLGDRATCSRECVAGGGSGFLDIADIKHRLAGQQAKLREDRLLSASAGHRSRRLAGLQGGQRRLHHIAAAALASLSPPLAFFCGRRRRGAPGFPDRPASIRSRPSRRRAPGRPSLRHG